MHIEWQVENNEYCRQVLKKHWPKTPCHYDITQIDWHYIPRVDLVCGGFPCQPFSVAGKQRGKADDRYLWPEVVCCLDALRPTWFLGENVPGIINLALDQVCTDLESLGYAVWPVCLPACAVDAPHIRQRIWIVAHTGSSESGRLSSCERQEVSKTGGDGKNATNTECNRLEKSRNSGISKEETNHVADDNWWPTEPNVGRVANGVPRRVDRLKGLGNAIVPQIVEEIGKMILNIHKEDSHASRQSE